MSELISGEDVLIALANGKDVEACVTQRLKKDEWHWFDAKSLTVNEIETMETDGNPDGSNILPIAFRLKPRTIEINGIEVPCNKSKRDKDDVVWVINTACENWYDWIYGLDCDSNTLYWETEEEIKQVVSALRSIFKGGV